MCITAFPMLARIIHFKNLAGTTMGTVALGAGAIDDAAAWCLLAIVLASFDDNCHDDAAPAPLDEVPRPGVEPLFTAGAELHPQRPGHDVDRRLLIPVVVPAGDHPRLRSDVARPHAVGCDRLAAMHPG